MKKYFATFVICLCIFSVVLAQEEPAAPTPGSEESTVIDLTQLGKTYTISARMELPQVKIIDKRITPDFKKVEAEKTFIGELSTTQEEIQFEPMTSGRVKPIPNIEALLKKKRF